MHETSIDRLVRAIAFDRAYALAVATCAGCGLPAVRVFSDYGVVWNACDVCLPAPDEVDLTVRMTSDLVALRAEDLPPGVREGTIDSPHYRYGCQLHVRVDSVDHVFELSDTDRRAVVPDGVTTFSSAFDGRFWFRKPELRERVQDLPNRKAVERLLRIGRAEP